MNEIIVKSMDDAERAARAMAASGFFQDAKQVSQAVVKILAGQELGFGPFASMTGVHIIQGRPTLAANLMAAAVKRGNKYNYRVIEANDAVCVLEWYEMGQVVGRSQYTIEEAQRAGLTSKDIWKKYTSDMLFARALSRGQKRFAPDIFEGATVYTPEEMGVNVDNDGTPVIDAVARDAGQPESSTNDATPKDAPAETRAEPTRPDPAPSASDDDEEIDPMGAWAVEYAALQWNIKKGEAAVSIASKKLQRLTKREFKTIVNGV